ncbi:MAG: DUF5677 domain-containing protein [Reyranella sp.]
MSLDRDGFLSVDLDCLKDRVRWDCPDVAGLVYDVSALGQKLLPTTASLPQTRQNLLAGVLFLRGLQSVQGAILMIERGMDLESRTLVRSAFETLFYLGAAAKEEEFVEDFMRDHIHRVDKLARAHRELSLAPEEDYAKLNTAIEEARDIAGAGRALSIRDAAKRAGMDTSYQGFYRGLSNDSAHPTVMSVSSHWARDEQGAPTGLLWGPELHDRERVQDTLFLIALVGILLIDAVNSLIDDKAVEQESHALSRTYLSLKGHTPSAELSANKAV